MAIVVVDAEESSSEGHHLSVGHKDTGVDLSRWRSEEGCSEEDEPKEAEDGGDPEL